MSSPIFTLGASEQVIQISQQQVLDADLKLNKLLVESVFYSAAGFAVGTGLSMFFKKKFRFVGYSTGLGLGFAIHQNGSPLIKQLC